MKFKPVYQAPQLNLAGYKKALDKYLRELLALGLAAWLDAVVAEVPVWSGASRATFLKIAGEISYPISVGGPARDRTGIGQSMSKGELTADIDSGLYAFTYGTSLPWLVWNEYHNANVEPDPTRGCTLQLKKPGPYLFQVKGAAAFLHATGDISLPRVGSYIKGKRVR